MLLSLLLNQEKMNKRENKKYFKFGWSLFYLIPVWLIILGILIMTIIAEEFIGALFVLLLLFISLTLYLRWVLYFGEAFFCTFYIVEGLKKIPYNRIEKILYKTKYAGGAPTVISVYFQAKKDKLKFAKFETGTSSYTAEILNFIDGKVKKGVLKENSFSKIGIERIDGVFKNTK